MDLLEKNEEEIRAQEQWIKAMEEQGGQSYQHLCDEYK